MKKTQVFDPITKLGKIILLEFGKMTNSVKLI